MRIGSVLAGVVTSAVLVALGGCTDGDGGPVTAAPSPEESPPPADPAAVDPVVVDLVTHCGIEVITFEGRTWRAVEAAPEPQRLPDAAGVVTYTGTTAGELVLVDDDELRFTVRDPLSAADGQFFDFRPVPEGAPPSPVCA
ncbi:hypothetical protein [Blastococcus sp. LR1]|uniref:hypothetical protein n=1 Tax=Blastococcus sp. LR1 TaxID=2877000 RepID=UPI001CC95701|nr:hypothetical protein [Blastococcus sp. LR1]MCA0145791.1 hypothetical protein [Blastococcus sp. LR1]